MDHPWRRCKTESDCCLAVSVSDSGLRGTGLRQGLRVMLLGFRVNPLTPRNDKYLIYPNSISLESHFKVMRMKEMFTD